MIISQTPTRRGNHADAKTHYVEATTDTSSPWGKLKVWGHVVVLVKPEAQSRPIGYYLLDDRTGRTGVFQHQAATLVPAPLVR